MKNRKDKHLELVSASNGKGKKELASGKKKIKAEVDTTWKDFFVGVLYFGWPNQPSSGKTLKSREIILKGIFLAECVEYKLIFGYLIIVTVLPQIGESIFDTHKLCLSCQRKKLITFVFLNSSTEKFGEK